MRATARRGRARLGNAIGQGLVAASESSGQPGFGDRNTTSVGDLWSGADNGAASSISPSQQAREDAEQNLRELNRLQYGVQANNEGFDTMGDLWAASVANGRRATALPDWATASQTGTNDALASYFPVGTGPIGASAYSAASALSAAAAPPTTYYGEESSNPSPGPDDSYTTWSGSEAEGHVEITHHMGFEERAALAAQIDAARAALDALDEAPSPLAMYDEYSLTMPGSGQTWNNVIAPLANAAGQVGGLDALMHVYKAGSLEVIGDQTVEAAKSRDTTGLYVQALRYTLIDKLMPDSPQGVVGMVGGGAAAGKVLGIAGGALVSKFPVLSIGVGQATKAFLQSGSGVNPLEATLERMGLGPAYVGPPGPRLSPSGTVSIGRLNADGTLARPAPTFMSDGTQMPFGFGTEEEYLNFASALRSGLPEGVEPVFQGSSVTGVKGSSSGGIPAGTPFDVGRVSDFDIGLISEDFATQASVIDGVRVKVQPTRIGPLSSTDPLAEPLGLADLASNLSSLAGRQVKFMLYDSIEGAYSQPTLFVPNPGN